MRLPFCYNVPDGTSMLQCNGQGMTSLEIELACILNDLGFIIKTQGLKTPHQEIEASLNDAPDVVLFQMIIVSWVLDFALPKARIAIEVDGDYWHGGGRLDARAIEQRIHDLKRDNQLRRQGWKVLRIKEGCLTKERVESAILSLLDV